MLPSSQEVQKDVEFLKAELLFVCANATATPHSECVGREIGPPHFWMGMFKYFIF